MRIYMRGTMAFFSIALMLILAAMAHAQETDGTYQDTADSAADAGRDTATQTTSASVQNTDELVNDATTQAGQAAQAGELLEKVNVVGTVSKPQIFTFDNTGNMIVVEEKTSGLSVDNDDVAIARISPTGSKSIVTENIGGAITDLAHFNEKLYAIIDGRLAILDETDENQSVQYISIDGVTNPTSLEVMGNSLYIADEGISSGTTTQNQTVNQGIIWKLTVVSQAGNNGNQSGTMDTQNEGTANDTNRGGVIGSKGTLSVKEWYPKGPDYVFVCDVEIPGFEPTKFSWFYGDGHKLIDIANQETYHVYETLGRHFVVCIGSDGNYARVGMIEINVTSLQSEYGISDQTDSAPTDNESQMPEEDNTTMGIGTGMGTGDSNQTGGQTDDGENETAGTTPTNQTIGANQTMDGNDTETNQTATDETNQSAVDNGTGESDQGTTDGATDNATGVNESSTDTGTNTTSPDAPVSSNNDTASGSNETDTGTDGETNGTVIGSDDEGSTNGTGSDGGTENNTGTTPTIEVEFSTTLNGAAESTPVNTDATGNASLTTDENGLLEVNGTFEGLEGQLLSVSGSPVHIHFGAIGSSGPVVFPLEVSASDDNRSGTFSLSVQLTAEQQENLKNGLYYVNVHSVANPAGEIRGQIFPLTEEGTEEATSPSEATQQEEDNADAVAVAPTSQETGTEDNETATTTAEREGAATGDEGTRGTITETTDPTETGTESGTETEGSTPVSGVGGRGTGVEGDDSADGTTGEGTVPPADEGATTTTTTNTTTAAADDDTTPEEENTENQSY